jgi:xanthine/CO dehydrogenase XdhC/CoxF family maturation factor
MQFAETCVRSQRRGAIVTVIRSEAPGIRTGMRVAVMERDEANGDKFDTALRAGMIADARAAIATGESCNRTYRSDLGNVDVFIEAMLPPPCVFVFGTGHDAVPLVALVRSRGWEVCVCTDAPARSFASDSPTSTRF